ncbi:MAG: biotin transporter BioY [Chloroflexi bacterium]|nr:biotin transporter BioY [Chloroflexota bacterium]
MQRNQGMALAQAIFPRTGLWRDAVLILGFTGFIALCARVAIYIGPVPITGQTLGVLLTGAVLGSRRGSLTLLVYLAEGAMGLPVFAAGNSGLPYMLSYSGGYLVGFVAAAWAVGFLAERGWDRSLWGTAAAMALGNVVLYVPGLLWLLRFFPPERLLVGFVLPYLPGDAAKLIVAALVLPSAWALARRI